MAGVLARRVPPGGHLVLAYSGGLDSTVLLYTLVALRDSYPFALTAVHVHHGLSPNADAWATFCATTCGTRGVPLTVEKLRLLPGDPDGIEAAARRERRRVFAGIEADFLLTAHHQDDQAETFLLQALRGAGPKGLAAMAECQRPPGWQAAQLRPLLGVARAELKNVADELGLDWIEDESNASDRFRRNVLRRQFMPRLAEHFPGCSVTLARSATHQAETAGLLDDLARLDAVDALAETAAGMRLDCAVLGQLTSPRARNLLRFFIACHGVALPGTRRLDEALHQLCSVRRDARVRIELGMAQLWVWRGGAFVVPTGEMPASVAWQGEAELTLPGLGALELQKTVGQGLRYAALAEETVSLGCRQGGEHLRLAVGGPTRSLKTLLQEHEVPPWERARLPVLTCGDATVWAAGFGCHADWLAGPDEAGLLPMWRKP